MTMMTRPNSSRRGPSCRANLRPRRLASTFVVLAWLLPNATRAAGEVASNLPSLQEIRSVMAEQRSKIRSLKVKFSAKASALEAPEALRKYLRVLYLVDEAKTFAFKGEKRYFKIQGPALVDDIAPGVDTDWDAVFAPDKEKLRAILDRQAKDYRPKAVAAGKKVQHRVSTGSEFGFDGRTLRRKTPESNLAIVMTPDRARLDSQYFSQEYLGCLKMTLPNVLDPADDRKGQRFPDAFAVREYQVQPRTEEVDGHRCVVVSCPGRETLWLDPEMNYSLRRSTSNYLQTDVLGTRYTNTDFQEIESGVWLPRRCRHEMCGPPQAPAKFRGKPLIAYTYDIQELSINNVPDSLFTLTIDPGMTVVDSTVPGVGSKSAYYIMPADPSKLDETISESLMTQRRAESKAWWSRNLIWMNLGVVALVASYFSFRAVQRASRRARMA